MAIILFIIVCWLIQSTVKDVTEQFLNKKFNTNTEEEYYYDWD